MPNVFQTFLNQVSSGYKEADKRLGGWLPGGGTASPVTRAKQEGEKRMAAQIINQREPNLAGRFAKSGPLVNALLATTTADTNPLGIVMGDKTQVKKLADYYQQNPDATNQYDLNTNMFLRYISGVGSKGLQIPQEVGTQIYKDVQEQEKKFLNPELRQGYISGGLGAPEGFKENILAGNTPVYYLGHSESLAPHKTTLPKNIDERWQLDKSLGSYWAQPGAGQNYNISDRYNFAYAPKIKEGGQVKLPERTGLSGFTAFMGGQPLANVGRNLVKTGYGTPYTTNLEVTPEGKVTVR
jgi:hypothetical protein